jgi:phosphate transport system substrate-binding protein
MRTPRLTPAVVVAFALAGCGPTPPPPDTGPFVNPNAPISIGLTAAVTLDGGGATFIQPIMQFWKEEFRQANGDKVRINYQATASSDGVKRMTSKELAFGCSDAPMSQAEVDEAKGKGGEVFHVPLVAGAVVAMYNLDLDQPLTFSGPLLADIYLGKVRKWNDPAVAALNPGVALPDLAIQPVFRSEGSGTSYVFTEYLSKVSPEFKAKVGATKQFKDDLKVGLGKKGSEGLAGHVTTTKGAIGYVELTYALDTKAKFGRVVNKAGKPIEPTPKSVTAAVTVGMAQPQTDPPYSLHDLTYNLTDLGGDDTYPISVTCFCLLYQKQPAGRKPLVEFLRWATSDAGQALAERRNFAPLPADLRKKVADKLNAVTFE